MRLAVLSDIHSNLTALEAVLADIPDVDEIWCLGDTVGYGPEPNEVIAVLRDRDARAVLGNHDGAALGSVDITWFNPDAAAAIMWTAGVLTDDSRAYLASLQTTRSEGELTAVHGSPRDPIWEYIVSPGVALANMAAFSTRWCLFGHTHLPVIYAEEGSGMAGLAAMPGEVQPLPDGRALINPGSVGQPRDGDPDASYLVLDLDAGTAEFRRIAYDIAQTQARMRKVGLPAWLIERLAEGR
jgi:predicted phosphodiesterase